MRWCRPGTTLGWVRATRGPSALDKQRQLAPAACAVVLSFVARRGGGKGEPRVPRRDAQRGTRVCASQSRPTQQQAKKAGENMPIVLTPARRGRPVVGCEYALCAARGTCSFVVVSCAAAAHTGEKGTADLCDDIARPSVHRSRTLSAPTTHNTPSVGGVWLVGERGASRPKAEGRRKQQGPHTHTRAQGSVTTIVRSFVRSLLSPACVCVCVSDTPVMIRGKTMTLFVVVVTTPATQG